mgnify:CR=1 FL=1
MGYGVAPVAGVAAVACAGYAHAALGRCGVRTDHAAVVGDIEFNAGGIRHFRGP